MERLTDKETKTLKYSEENNITLSNSRIENGKRKSYFYGKPIEKLAEFEDFMEENGFESLEKLKEFIEIQETNIRFYSRISEENSNKNQALKDRWQKLKEWASYLCYFELVDKMEELEKE